MEPITYTVAMARAQHLKKELEDAANGIGFMPATSMSRRADIQALNFLIDHAKAWEEMGRG